MRKPTESANRQPVYWFVRLEQALDSGNFLAAQQAVRELAALGVQVRYGRPQTTGTRPRNGGAA
jgi:hypothetical protein